jgi:N-acetylmuramoyl-L-alanine amidase
MRVINYIAIHCTATQQNASVESILRYWKESLKWKSVGYHRLIEADGTIHNLSHFDKPTNGVKGFNHESIHISYIGGVTPENKPIDNRTEMQKVALLICIREALEYVGKKVIIQGHRDFGANKACPSFDAKNEYIWITV